MEKGLLFSQNTFTDIKDHWSKGWNKTKNPNIWKSLREDSLQSEQMLHGYSCLASQQFGKLNHKTPIWNDTGDQSDYQLEDFNAGRKLKDKESQSVASETEPLEHLHAFQPVYNPKPKSERLGCFI